MTSHRIIGVTIIFAALTIPIGCGTPADVGDEVTAKQTEDTANKLGHRLSRLHHYFHRKEEPHAAEWSYSGESGPAHWGDLSPEYVLAKDGQQQSPIDIQTAANQELPQLTLDYKPSKINLVYNGHTIEETEDQGSSLVVDGHQYAFKQFHFHAPSEHTIDGKHAEMEMHLVHIDDDGQIAVIGVMINEGTENSAFEPVWNYLPTSENKRLQYDAVVDAQAMLPKDLDYYHYAGSLTTPPCSEGVRWYLLTTPIELSKQQIDRFKAIIDNNNRPVQPLNRRVVVRSQH